MQSDAELREMLAQIEAKYARCAEIKASDMTAIQKITAWPFAEDDQIIQRSQLGDITVGDLRALLDRIEVLEKALRPFAEAGDYIKSETIGYEPSDQLWLAVVDSYAKMHGLLKLEFAAFYDARTAIEGGKP